MSNMDVDEQWKLFEEKCIEQGVESLAIETGSELEYASEKEPDWDAYTKRITLINQLFPDMNQPHKSIWCGIIPMIAQCTEHRWENPASWERLIENNGNYQQLLPKELISRFPLYQACYVFGSPFELVAPSLIWHQLLQFYCKPRMDKPIDKIARDFCKELEVDSDDFVYHVLEFAIYLHVRNITSPTAVIEKLHEVIEEVVPENWLNTHEMVVQLFIAIPPNLLNSTMEEVLNAGLAHRMVTTAFTFDKRLRFLPCMQRAYATYNCIFPYDDAKNKFLHAMVQSSSLPNVICDLIAQYASFATETEPLVPKNRDSLKLKSNPKKRSLEQEEEEEETEASAASSSSNSSSSNTSAKVQQGDHKRAKI